MPQNIISEEMPQEIYAYQFGGFDFGWCNDEMTGTTKYVRIDSARAAIAKELNAEVERRANRDGVKFNRSYYAKQVLEEWSDKT